MNNDYVRYLLIESRMPDWVKAGGYDSNSEEAKVELMLRQFAAGDVDNFLKCLKDNHLYIVGTGAKAPRPEPPPIPDDLPCDCASCNDSHLPHEA
jgi:hypothetical protein